MAENMKMEEDARGTTEDQNIEENIDEAAKEECGSSESEDSDDNEAVHDPRIQQLELQVASSPYHYDSHVELIKLLRESGDLDRVRDAREGMSKNFPLTEELWLEWLKDEMPLASIPEQREKVTALFERAVRDYQSVRVWILYCQFMMDIMEGEDGLQAVRSTFEKAIIAAGLHVTEGSSIWEGYRELEMDILGSLEQMVTEENKEVMAQKITSQKERVMSVFKRQLAVPLLGTEWMSSLLNQASNYFI